LGIWGDLARFLEGIMKQHNSHNTTPMPCSLEKIQNNVPAFLMTYKFIKQHYKIFTILITIYATLKSTLISKTAKPISKLKTYIYQQSYSAMTRVVNLSKITPIIEFDVWSKRNGGYNLTSNFIKRINYKFKLIANLES
jgi:hypothetical protein